MNGAWKLRQQYHVVKHKAIPEKALRVPGG